MNLESQKNEFDNDKLLLFLNELKTKLNVELRLEYVFNLTFKEHKPLILFSITVGILGISNIIDSINTGERVYIIFNIINAVLLLLTYYGTNKIMEYKFLIRKLEILEMLDNIELIENEIENEIKNNK